MKKTLSLLAVIGAAAIIGSQTANAFTWSDLNPFNWGRCNRCEKQVNNCPCTTGAAAPCDPCVKKTPCDPCQKQIVPSRPCDECDRLQQHMAR